MTCAAGSQPHMYHETEDRDMHLPRPECCRTKQLNRRTTTMATKGTLDGKTATRTTKTSPVPGAGRRNGRPDTQGAKSVQRSSGARSRAADSRGSADRGTTSARRVRATTQPKAAAKLPTASPSAEGVSTWKASRSKSEIIAADYRQMLDAHDAELRRASRSKRSSWFYNPYLVAILLGAALVAIVGLVTRNTRCVGACGLGFIAGAFLFHQAHKELA